MRDLINWFVCFALVLSVVIVFVPGIARWIGYMLIKLANAVEWFYIEIPLAWRGLWRKYKQEHQRW